MIGLYNQGATEGRKDGILVNGTNKISFILNSSENQEDTQVLGIRTLADEHKTVGKTTIALEGQNASKWALSLDGETWNEYGLALEISTDIVSNNTLFHIKAKSTDGEGAQTDATVSVKVSCVIGMAK